MCEEIYENFYLTGNHNGNITTENGTSEQKWTIVHLAGSFFGTETIEIENYMFK